MCDVQEFPFDVSKYSASIFLSESFHIFYANSQDDLVETLTKLSKSCVCGLKLTRLKWREREKYENTMKV